MKAKRLDPNDHIRKYLHYYLELPSSPGYAVLVGGPWGVGKTHIVKAILREIYPDLNTPAWVSLYGVTSTAEIDRAVAHAIHPFLKTGTSQIAGQAVRAFAGVFRLKTDLTAEQFVGIDGAPAYVFDDLERAVMPLGEVLGYINRFVEQDRQKVIILADESRIDDPKYDLVREKLIGQTLTAQSVAPDALDAFINAMRCTPAQSALRDRRRKVLDIHALSEVPNLRILQHAVRQFDRVFEALSTDQRAHPEAIDAILGLIFPLVFELRFDRVKPADLKDRLRSRFRWGNTEPSPIGRAAERYDGYDIYSQVLTDEVLQAVLVDGLVQAAAIQESVNASGFFTSPGHIPAWQIVWHYHTHEQSEVQQAIAEIDDQFNQRTLSGWATILHVFATASSERGTSFRQKALPTPRNLASITSRICPTSGVCPTCPRTT